MLWEARFLLKFQNLVYIFEEGEFIAMKKVAIFITLACVVMISPVALATRLAAGR